MPTDVTRCGYVTLVGAPNVGKSTLLNALVGEPLSIVTPKAQTTWTRVTGIRTSGTCQAIFLDTPGLLEPRSLLHRSFRMGAEEAVAEADVVAVMADPLHTLSRPKREMIEQVLESTSAPRIGIVNKVDAADSQAVETERRWLEALGVDEVHLVSAEEGGGLDPLIEALEARLPESPFLYPEDELASEPMRFFVAETVRQVIFEQFHQEIPYASICRVEAFREQEDPVYIQVTIYVERPSQKGILIGDKGSAIRTLGIAARSRIEDLLGRPVYLDLWVKVLAGWRRKPEHLRRLGLPVPETIEDDRAG